MYPRQAEVGAGSTNGKTLYRPGIEIFALNSVNGQRAGSHRQRNGQNLLPGIRSRK